MNKILISIYLHNIGFTPAGVLYIDEDKKYSQFSYLQDYIDNDYPALNPATLNWKSDKKTTFITTIKDNKQMLDRTFWEMLPGQNDWGNQVLISRFPEYQNMNNAQKLYFLGDHIVGGLKAQIQQEVKEESINNIDYLDNIRNESLLFYQKQLNTIKYVGAIKSLTSYGGVRPKCMYEDEGDFWIVKFNLPDDPYNMAIAEQIAMDMSKDCGIPTADSKLVTLPSGEMAFFSKRFDRINNDRFHSLSFFSLVPGNEHLKTNTPGVQGNPASFIKRLIERYSDFENMDTINFITKMLLDIGVNNTDNHLKNLRIIMNKNYKWELAPMYDIIFNPLNQNHIYNPGNLPQHELYLENPKIITSMSESFNIKPEIIEEQLEKVKQVLYNWEFYCNKYDMNDDDREKIAAAISLGLHRDQHKITLKNKNKISNNLKFNGPKLKPI